MTQIDKIEPLPMDLEKLSKLMEEMANMPKEEMGKRQPGERCMYEIQRLKRDEEKISGVRLGVE